jgi:hypothetical protein
MNPTTKRSRPRHPLLEEGGESIQPRFFTGNGDPFLLLPGIILIYEEILCFLKSVIWLAVKTCVGANYNVLICLYLLMVWFGFVVFNATFNNIPVISWRSVLLVEETRVPGENPSEKSRLNALMTSHVISFIICSIRLIGNFECCRVLEPCITNTQYSEVKHTWRGWGGRWRKP